MRTDFLIIGAGLAGNILTDHLLKAGKSVEVLDDPSLSNSSKVAGGLYNPITGREMVKTWNCDNLFDYLIPYYQDLEKELAAKFLIDRPIYRPFLSFEEQNEWMARSVDSQFSPYINEILTKPSYPEVNDPYGGLLLDNSGYLNTSKFLEAVQNNLKERKLLINETFNADNLDSFEDHFEYGGKSYGHVIFCDGRLSVNNPFFSWLPFSLVKGELLFVRSNVTPKVVHNRGIFVIPLENGLLKCGSTYDHQDLDENPTFHKAEELKSKVSKLMNFEFEIIDQKAGVRPASRDRKPFIGEHPTIKRMWVFNGFGTKGVSLIPYYAKQFVERLNNKKELDKEVNIERYFSLF